VLSQKVTFAYEVIVGEDYSTDQTLQIAKDYQVSHPGTVRVVQSGHKKKLVIDGHPTGRLNFLNVLRQCQGRYIALLDGDDYWTDTGKLQQQVNFLENNPEYALTFHNVRYASDDPAILLMRRETYHPIDFPENGGLEEKLLTHNIVPTGAVMLRNNIPKEFPEAFYKVPVGDWPFQLYNLNFGKMHYMNEVMGAYRLGGGAWARKNRLDQLRTILHTYKYLAEIVPPRLELGLKKACAYHFRLLVAQYWKERKPLRMLMAVLKFRWYLLTGRLTQIRS
jgi:glycosyltransferase involved in cell wall biosynthesis